MSYVGIPLVSSIKGCLMEKQPYKQDQRQKRTPPYIRVAIQVLCWYLAVIKFQEVATGLTQSQPSNTPISCKGNWNQKQQDASLKHN